MDRAQGLRRRPIFGELMSKKKEINVGVEALRISEEQNITFKQAWDIALAEKKLKSKIEEKLSK